MTVLPPEDITQWTSDDPVPAPNVVMPTSDTPDPYGTADQAQYNDGDSTGDPDESIDFLPPWALTRAPGTVRTVAPGEIVPVNPWAQYIALLNANQVAALNTFTAARQAAAMWCDDPHAY